MVRVLRKRNQTNQSRKETKMTGNQSSVKFAILNETWENALAAVDLQHEVTKGKVALDINDCLKLKKAFDESPEGWLTEDDILEVLDRPRQQSKQLLQLCWQNLPLADFVTDDGERRIYNGKEFLKNPTLLYDLWLAANKKRYINFTNLVL